MAVGVIAVIALVAWFFSTSSSTIPGTSTSTVPTTTAQAVPSTKTTKPVTKGIPNSQTTYKSLLTQTGSYQCDYSGVQATGQTSNVIYLYDGKMRGEFRTTHQDGSAEANLFVYDGRYMYQWKEGSSSGTRTVLTSLSQLPLIIPKDLTSGAIVGDSYKSVGWLCHTWLTNKALLVPPSYVTF